MPTFKFAKLVRDGIVDQQVASGATPHYRILTEDEHKTALVQKIQEEAQEILDAPLDQVAGEIADVQQAIDDLAEKYGLTPGDIKAAQEAKNKKNGSFKKGIYVERVDVDEQDPWTSYYRQHADRYPEDR